MEEIIYGNRRLFRKAWLTAGLLASCSTVSVNQERQGRGSRRAMTLFSPLTQFSWLWGLMFTARTILPTNCVERILRALWALLCSQKGADQWKGRLCTSLWRHGASQPLWIRALGSSPPLIYCTGLVCLAQHRHSVASWLHIPCYFPFMLPLAETSLQRGRTNYLFLHWRGYGGESGGKQLLLPRW